MKFTTTTLLTSTAALAAAAPVCTAPTATPASNTATTINTFDRFRIQTLRSGSDFQYASLQALSRGFRINAPSQNASCDAGANPDFATFYLLENGDLYLNTDFPPQQAFVDRSGMGQGVVQFTSGVQPIGRNQERGPFKVDENNNLVFDAGNGETTGFQACPGAVGGGYSVWLAGATEPAGLKGCVGFTARAQKVEEDVRCQYTNE
jgi:hypothetical protein